MATNATGLADLMDSKAQAAFPIENAAARAGRKAMFTAVAEAMVEHFTTFAQISGVAVGLVAPPGGGPVTGTLVLPPGSIS
jgi:hypothetical protein